MTEKQKNWIAAGLIVLAAALMAAGVLRGENTVVWRKAVNLCMECIGLG